MARGNSRGSVAVARDCVEYGVPDAWSYYERVHVGLCGRYPMYDKHFIDVLFRPSRKYSPKTTITARNRLIWPTRIEIFPEYRCNRNRPFPGDIPKDCLFVVFLPGSRQMPAGHNGPGIPTDPAPPRPTGHPSAARWIVRFGTRRWRSRKSDRPRARNVTRWPPTSRRSCGLELDVERVPPARDLEGEILGLGFHDRHVAP